VSASENGCPPERSGGRALHVSILRVLYVRFLRMDVLKFLC
jgi:hypothetical protein